MNDLNQEVQTVTKIDVTSLFPITLVLRTPNQMLSLICVQCKTPLRIHLPSYPPPVLWVLLLVTLNEKLLKLMPLVNLWPVIEK